MIKWAQKWTLLGKSLVCCQMYTPWQRVHVLIYLKSLKNILCCNILGANCKLKYLPTLTESTYCHSPLAIKRGSWFSCNNNQRSKWANISSSYLAFNSIQEPPPTPSLFKKRRGLGVDLRGMENWTYLQLYEFYKWQLKSLFLLSSKYMW